MSSSSSCTLCSNPIRVDPTRVGIAHFKCGHMFHLNCALLHASHYRTSCPQCTMAEDLAPHMGGDRRVAIAANVAAARRRRLVSVETSKKSSKSFWSFSNNAPTSLREHLTRRTPVAQLTKAGFAAEDFVSEAISWNEVVSKYNVSDLLNFGLRWTHAKSMGIRPYNLKSFTWAQIRHVLNITAQDLLSIDTTLSDLGSLGVGPVHLVEMGFDWMALEAMGASVETLKGLNVSVEDIKTYWKPTVSQWERAGFYNRQRLLRSEWNVDRVTATLPDAGWRSNGRTRRSRLEF